MVCPIRTQRHSKSLRQQSTQVTNILLPSAFVSLSQIAKGVTGAAVGSDLPFSCQFALPFFCAFWASAKLVATIRFPHLSPIRRARCLLRAGLSLFTFHSPSCAFAVPFFAFLALFAAIKVFHQSLITTHQSRSSGPVTLALCKSSYHRYSQLANTCCAHSTSHFAYPDGRRPNLFGSECTLAR
jgi:hypothetical protein